MKFKFESNDTATDFLTPKENKILADFFYQRMEVPIIQDVTTKANEEKSRVEDLGFKPKVTEEISYYYSSVTGVTITYTEIVTWPHNKTEVTGTRRFVSNFKNSFMGKDVSADSMAEAEEAQAIIDRAFKFTK